MNDEIKFNTDWPLKRGPELILRPEPDASIEFNLPDLSEPILEIKANGDFFVRGKKVTGDIEVYKAFIAFLKI